MSAETFIVIVYYKDGQKSTYYKTKYNKSTLENRCDIIKGIMDERTEIEQQLSSSKWYEEQASALLIKYHNCPTMREQAKMLPVLTAMLGKLKFQRNELKKYMANENI
jgi:hypothetical protein